jgi:hypothetical protein
LKEKGKKSKRKHRKRKSSGLLPGGMEALIPLFEDQSINCKLGKICAVLKKGLGWLAGLINTALSYYKGHLVHVLMLISRPLILCLR